MGKLTLKVELELLSEGVRFCYPVGSIGQD